MIFKLPPNFPPFLSDYVLLVSFESPNIKGDHDHLLKKTTNK